jgi:hypothetical protein
MGKAAERTRQESLRVRAGKYAIPAAAVCAISALYVLSSNDFTLLLLPVSFFVMRAMKAGDHAKAVLSAAFIASLIVSSAAIPSQAKAYMSDGVLSYAFFATLAMASLADILIAGNSEDPQVAGKSGFSGFSKKQAFAARI